MCSIRNLKSKIWKFDKVFLSETCFIDYKKNSWKKAAQLLNETFRQKTSEYFQLWEWPLWLELTKRKFWYVLTIWQIFSLLYSVVFIVGCLNNLVTSSLIRDQGNAKDLLLEIDWESNKQILFSQLINYLGLRWC